MNIKRLIEGDRCDGMGVVIPFGMDIHHQVNIDFVDSLNNAATFDEKFSVHPFSRGETVPVKNQVNLGRAWAP
jgi:hypothetical protein